MEIDFTEELFPVKCSKYFSFEPLYLLPSSSQLFRLVTWQQPTHSVAVAERAD